MASDTTSLYSQRPSYDGQIVSYADEQKYKKRAAYEDKLAILVCQIKIWRAKDRKWFDIPKVTDEGCLTIRECESVEVTDSIKDLVNKAVVKFPRGTVISESSKKGSKIRVGEKSDSTATSQNLGTATNDGEVMTVNSSVYEDNNVSTTSAAINYDDKGLVEFNRTDNDPALLTPNDIAIGNRIEIRCGYAYSETEFNKLNTSDNGKGSPLDIVFTGFITSISVDTPLELECTNMAHILSSISTPNIPDQASLLVKDFLDDDGKYHLLKDTGIPLAEASKACEINVMGASITENLTVTEVLEKWNDSGVHCILDTLPDGRVELRVGLMYYAGQGGSSLPTNDKKYLTYSDGVNTVKLIQFDWDVAQDKLTLKRNDRKYIAIEASGWYTNVEYSKTVTKRIKLTLRKNPDHDDEGWLVDEGEFQVVNSRESKGQKVSKHKNGTTSNKRIQGHLENRVDLKNYTVIPYQSVTPNISREDLIKEAKQFYAKCNANGIAGSIEIFGDLYIKPTEIVGLIDKRQPHKNGYYFVESVNTTFGMNGFRRELSLPYKIGELKVKFID